MSYESAPATLLVATQCAVCARPLVDSESVNTGMGPECRKKHGYTIDAPADARNTANRLVHGIALDRNSLDSLKACDTLESLGFTKLAAILRKRIASIVVTITDGRYAVKTPYNPDTVDAMRRIPGRRWDAEGKVNTFPASSARELFDLLKRYHAGALAIGPKGPFQV